METLNGLDVFLILIEYIIYTPFTLLTFNDLMILILRLFSKKELLYRK